MEGSFNSINFFQNICTWHINKSVAYDEKSTYFTSIYFYIILVLVNALNLFVSICQIDEKFYWNISDKNIS